MSDILLHPVDRPFSAIIRPPGSKSLTNRALVLAALADGVSTLSNVLFADDTRVMLDCLGRLGFELKIDEAAKSVQVSGGGGRVNCASAELFCGNSGTTIRFLTALCALGHGRFTLDGVPRMRRRPIGQLIESLREIGVRVTCLEADGFPPLRIDADGLAGGRLHFAAGQSSQFLSALLMVGPYARRQMTIDLGSGQTSWPYVAMTLRMIEAFGVAAAVVAGVTMDQAEPRRIDIPRGVYRARHYAIEPDASNASYFLAAAAIHAGSTVTIPGLGRCSLQGDVRFAEVLKQMGAQATISDDAITVTGPQHLHGIDVDLSSMPDTAQTLAVAAIFARGPTTIRGLHTLRVKETDRLAALSVELTKLGAKIKIEGDALTIHPPRSVEPAEIATYDDHRMAMSFSLAGTKAYGVTIKDAGCVAKTYPNYFDDLKKVLAGEPGRVGPDRGGTPRL